MKTACRIAISALVALLTCACVKDETPDYGDRDCIRILMDPSGIGDGGYNDFIYKGAVGIWSSFSKYIPVYIATPDNLQQAEQIVSQWLREIDAEHGGKHLLVFASSTYEPLCLEVAQSIDTKEVDLLLFESDYTGPMPLHCFSTCLYGACWLSGALAADAGVHSPSLLMANPMDEGILEAAQGFSDGFAACPERVYLSEEKGSGYAQSFDAYTACGLLVRSHDYIFPLAGGSNSGVYRFLRENPKGVYTAGMDSDKSRECSAVMSNVIKRMDLLVAKVLRDWIEKGSLPDGQVYGLQSGYVECTLSYNFSQMLVPSYNNRINEALSKEYEHLSKH